MDTYSDAHTVQKGEKKKVKFRDNLYIYNIVFCRNRILLSLTKPSSQQEDMTIDHNKNIHSTQDNVKIELDKQNITFLQAIKQSLKYKKEINPSPLSSFFTITSFTRPLTQPSSIIQAKKQVLITSRRVNYFLHNMHQSTAQRMLSSPPLQFRVTLQFKQF